MTNFLKRSNLIDKAILIVLALSIFVFGIPLYLFLNKSFSEDWTMFIMMSLGYLIALFYLPFTSKKLRQMPKIKLFIFQFVMAGITIGISVLIFKLELLPMPKVISIYGIAMVLLLAGTMVLLEYCVKNKIFFKEIKK